MNDNTLTAIALLAFAVMIHGCTSCAKQKDMNEHELAVEKLRFEHSQKAGKP